MDEEALLRQLQAGDERVLEVLLDRYGSDVYAVVARVLESTATPHDIEELRASTKRHRAPSRRAI